MRRVDAQSGAAIIRPHHPVSLLVHAVASEYLRARRGGVGQTGGPIFIPPSPRPLTQFRIFGGPSDAASPLPFHAMCACIVWYRELCAARVFVDIYLLAVGFLGFIPRHTRVLSCVKYLCVPVCSYRHIEEDDNPEPLDTADDDGEQVGLGCDGGGLYFFC